MTLYSCNVHTYDSLAHDIKRNQCPSGQATWKFITITDQTIKIVDNDAIVRHTLTGETERDGKTNPVKIGVLMVWHKQNGNWKLLARQAVRLEEAPRTN